MIKILITPEHSIYTNIGQAFSPSSLFHQLPRTRPVVASKTFSAQICARHQRLVSKKQFQFEPPAFLLPLINQNSDFLIISFSMEE
jgi:hypothetical protein